MDNDFDRRQISTFERFTINAFKEKNADDFTKYFAPDYIGAASDGVKDAAAEIQGMLKLDLDDIKVADEQISFPENNLAIMTYKMIVSGKLDQKDISGEIFCSSVYLKRQNGWQSVLHTETKAEV